jgi:hypothetical protein
MAQSEGGNVSLSYFVCQIAMGFQPLGDLSQSPVWLCAITHLFILFPLPGAPSPAKHPLSALLNFRIHPLKLGPPPAPVQTPSLRWDTITGLTCLHIYPSMLQRTVLFGLGLKNLADCIPWKSAGW